MLSRAKTIPDIVHYTIQKHSAQTRALINSTDSSMLANSQWHAPRAVAHGQAGYIPAASQSREQHSI